MSSIGRDEASDLVKRYGGRVTGAPSGKTDYVVIGDNPGESKIDKVKKLNLKTLDEDGLFDLIRSRSKNAPATATQEAKPEPVKKVQSPKKAAPVAAPSNATETDLWTVKYAPKKPEDLIGNHGIYKQLHDWLEAWKKGAPEKRAVLLSGPPGIGKTSMAHMACRLAGYDVVEMNASDTRSKKEPP